MSNTEDVKLENLNENNSNVIEIPQNDVEFPIKNTWNAINFYPDKVPFVRIRNLNVHYGRGAKKFRALKDINLNIYEGEVVGIVGESGSGKSTLGRALIGLVDHSSGEIKIADNIMPKSMGFSFKKLFHLKEHKKLRDFLVNKVQMIFQDPANSLNPHKNIYNVIAEGLNNISSLDIIYRFNFDEKTLNNLKLQIAEILTNESNDNDYHSHEDYKQFKHFRTVVKKELTSLRQGHYYDLIKTELLKFHSKAVKELAGDELTLRIHRREYDVKKSKPLKKEELIIDILKSVGLDETILKRFPLEFSGGQQQRVGISRSLVIRPKMLIADEPISALDVSIQASVINIFNELKEKFDLTIMFIAHDLRMVEYVSDRIIVMNNGRVLEMGPTKEVVQNYVHPYTRSLMDAVPSLESKKGSLLGYKYSEKMHEYTPEIQPEWIDLGNSHFVLATPKEVESWKAGKYD